MFEVGWAGGPGRPKGVNTVRDALKSLGVDPVVKLIEYAMDPSVHPNTRISIWKDLMPYLHPRLKQVTITDTDGNTLVPNMIQVVLPKIIDMKDNGESDDSA